MKNSDENIELINNLKSYKKDLEKVNSETEEEKKNFAIKVKYGGLGKEIKETSKNNKKKKKCFKEYILYFLSKV